MDKWRVKLTLESEIEAETEHDAKAMAIIDAMNMEREKKDWDHYCKTCKQTQKTIIKTTVGGISASKAEPGWFEKANTKTVNEILEQFKEELAEYFNK